MYYVMQSNFLKVLNAPPLTVTNNGLWLLKSCTHTTDIDRIFIGTIYKNTYLKTALLGCLRTEHKEQFSVLMWKSKDRRLL